MSRKRDWYSSNAVLRFSWNHIHFILENCHAISEGKYPPNPYQSGYTDYGTTIQKSSPLTPRILQIVEIHAELFRRISKCGADSSILLMHYEDGLPEERIAYHLSRVWHKPIGERGVRRAINRVIRYCTGEELRGCPYYNWKRAGRAGDCGECHQLSTCEYYHEPDLLMQPVEAKGCV